MYSFVPELLRVFRDSSPDVALRLHELGTTEQLRQLEDGRLDVGFVRVRRSWPGLAFETVQEEPVVVALPDAHPLAKPPLLRLADLRGQSLVLLTPAGSPGLRDSLADAIALLGGEDQIVQEVAEMHTVIGLVAAGVGISLVPESVRALARHGVTYRALTGEAPAVRLTMAWRATDDSPVLSAFLERARAAAPAEGERGRRGPAQR
jgi:DNA-binding transcriptional LysR family regulator